jgi:hypothetical protein
MKSFDFYIYQPLEFSVLGIPISVLQIKGLSQILLAVEFHIKKFDVGTGYLH